MKSNSGVQKEKVKGYSVQTGFPRDDSTHPGSAAAERGAMPSKAASGGAGGYPGSCNGALHSKHGTGNKANDF